MYLRVSLIKALFLDEARSFNGKRGHFHIDIFVIKKLSPWDVDPLVCDALDHLAREVEDRVLVRLHGLGRVDDKHERRVQHLIQLLSLTT